MPGISQLLEVMHNLYRYSSFPSRLREMKQN